MTSHDMTISNYISKRLYVEMVFSIPIICFGLFLTYIIHMSRNMNIARKNINKKTIRNKRRLTMIMVVYFIYQIILVLFMDNYIDIGDEFFYLFLQFFKICTSILTPLVLKEQARKIFHLPYKNTFLYFWIIISFICISDCMIEIYCGLFFRIITFASVGCFCSICLCYLFYKYPTDDSNLGDFCNVYYELQTLPFMSRTYSIGLDTLNRKKNILTYDSFKFNKNHKTNSNNLFRTLPIKNRDKANLSKSPCSTLAENLNFQQNISLDDISQKHPELLPSYPKIEITFKENYKYYQNTSIDLSDDSFQIENHSPRREKKDSTSRFFFQIQIIIKDKNVNKIIKRNIKDFFDMEMNLKKEITLDKFPKKLVYRLPRLKIPKICHRTMDFLKNYTFNFQIFLKNIVNEPCFITDDVLEFLEIEDDQLLFSYNMARKQFNTNVNRNSDDIFTSIKTKGSDKVRESVMNLKKEINEYNSTVNKKTASNFNNQGFILNNPSNTLQLSYIQNSGNSNFNSSNIHFTPLQTPVGAKKLSHKINVLEVDEKNSNIVFRISYSFTFKILKRKILEVMKLITELSNINKNNENIKRILKMFLNNSKIDKVILENSLQNVLDNFSQYKLNLITSEFFAEFFDDSVISPGQSVNFSDNVNFNPNSKYIKFKKLSEEKKILSVTADIPGTLFISIEFKPSIFYTVNLIFGLANEEKIEVLKKYKFKELKQYMDMMQMCLNLQNHQANNNPSFQIKKSFMNTEAKVELRKKELKEKLNELFSKKGFLEAEEWLDIFISDRKYKAFKKSQKAALKSPQLSHLPSFSVHFRNESRDSSNLYYRDSILPTNY